MTTGLALATPPLALRIMVSRVVSGILLVYGGVSASYALGAIEDVPVVLLALTSLPVFLALLWTVLGGLARLPSARAQEASLTGLALAAVASPLLVTSFRPEATEASLLVLPLLLLASALTAPLRPQLVITVTAAIAAQAIVVATPSVVAPWYFLPAIALAAGVLGGIATGILGHALLTAAESEALAVRATRAMRAVVTAAATTTDVMADRDQVLDAIGTAIGGVGADIGGIVLLDAGAERFTYTATYRIPADMAAGSYPADEGLFGEVVRRGETVVVEDYSTSSIAVNELRDREIGAAVGVPIREGDEIVGVVVAGRHDTELPGEGVTSALELLADLAGRAISLSRRIDDDQRAVRRLEALNEQQRDFVATASHELRTPVTVVDGLITTLREHGARLGPERSAELLERLAANSASLVSIVTTLLDATRLDHGLVPEEVQVDLSALVRDSVTRLETVLVDHAVTVHVTEGALVRGDHALLQRVVDNLLTNVERHTPAGTVVEVQVDLEHDLAVTSVVDHGPGIPTEMQHRISRRFVRGGDHRTRGTRGLGIGLSLADQVLRLHGSRLEVADTIGGGATFTFALPLARRSRGRDGAPPDTAPAPDE